MKLPTLAAIRAIVATHAQYPARLLAAIDEDIEHERACRPGTPMQSEEEGSMMGAQIKTTPRSRTWRSGSTGGLTEIGASAVNQSTQAPPIERNMAEELAALNQAHRERMDACECPSCIPPRIGDLLPDVLAEMRRREGK